jgi:hypothetical protein
MWTSLWKLPKVVMVTRARKLNKVTQDVVAMTLMSETTVLLTEMMMVQMAPILMTTGEIITQREMRRFDRESPGNPAKIPVTLCPCLRKCILTLPISFRGSG